MADTFSFTEQCGATELEPLLMFANVSESDTFELVNIFTHRVTSGGSQGGSPPGMAIDRVTSYSGGTAVDLVAARSDSASLAGDISLMVQPASVGGSTRIRRLGPVASTPDANAGQSAVLLPPGYQNYRLAPSRTGQGDLIGGGSGALDSLILGEGQGIAISQEGIGSGAGTFSAQRQRLRFSVLVSVSGNAYSAVFDVPSLHFNLKEFVIFNEVGSGVSLKIHRISLHVAKSGPYSDYSATAFNSRNGLLTSLCRVDYSLPLSDKEAITLVPARSDATNLSGKLYAVKGNAVGDYLVRDEMLHYALRRSALVEVPDFSSVGNFGALVGNQSFRCFRDRNCGETADAFIAGVGGYIQPVIDAHEKPIILRPGEAIALMCFGSRQVDYVFSGTVRYVPDPTVYPAVGDVDLGVQYGPTATDYTGTLEQPAENRVLSGINYGADGIEFTGTASGGGGGGVSRGRITNA